jgi:hypothetical protein
VGGATKDDPIKLLTLAEVLERFKGKIGQKFLVTHIRAVPRFAGGPTHRKVGAKYLFTEGDLVRIIESLAPAPVEQPLSRDAQVRNTVSKNIDYNRALALLSRVTPASKSKSKSLRLRNNED